MCLILFISLFHFFFFASYPFLSPVFDQVVGPPAAGAFRERPSKPTTFRKFYERGEFPMALEHDTKGNRIAWKVGMFHSAKDAYGFHMLSTKKGC